MSKTKTQAKQLRKEINKYIDICKFLVVNMYSYQYYMGVAEKIAMSDKRPT